jgi:uncharacterized protein (DUF2235 family)
MGRNLIICCDGTANQFAADRTNVLKLAYAAEKHDSRQLVYYHPGVGTMAPPGLFTALGKWTARLAGMAFGYGLKADIGDIYTFIINHFEPGDRLYIFGFSRGAYTARAVAALIHGYGLLGAGNDALVPYAIRLLWSANKARTDEARNHYFRLAAEFKSTLSVTDCRPAFLGLWDTVSSVGWIANPLSLPYTSALPNVAAIRHAVAIDERRAFFRTNLVAPDPARDIEEVWFPGVHCDVGGGYPEADSGLSKLPLEWMIGEAGKAGMLFDGKRVELVLGHAGHGYAPPDANARLHESLTWPWWPAEFVLKEHWDKVTGETHWRANLFGRRHFPTAPVVDDSAWARGADYLKRLPPDAIKRSLKMQEEAARRRPAGGGGT